ncbi:hypothetical protein [Sanguibacter gelidistatuariae]|uniref:hypothetical protein n=1 Tax=Sanguibacter gelidistatuariae TaxID=1814289 RepID=UPI001113B675|nr:hypothetical protein [Sanguibacter gelidistatuariae]
MMESIREVIFLVGVWLVLLCSCACPLVAFPWIGPAQLPRSMWPAVQARSGIPIAITAAGFILVAVAGEPLTFSASSALAGVLLVLGLRLPRTVQPPAGRGRQQPPLTGRHAVPWRSPGPGMTPRMVVLGCGFTVGLMGFFAMIGVAVPNAPA